MEPLFKPAKPNWCEVARRVTIKLKRHNNPVHRITAYRVYIGDVRSDPILKAINEVFAEDKERSQKAKKAAA